jgi:hypothetical protein
MKCADCQLLDLSTRVARRMAAIGYAVCQRKLTPKDEGYPNLQSWPIYALHPCDQGVSLDKDGKSQREAVLAKYREFLERGRNAKR